MKTLNTFSVDEYGTVIYDVDYLIQRIFEDDIDISQYVCFDTEKVKQYNQCCFEFDKEEQSIKTYTKSITPLSEFDDLNQNVWFIPDNYKNIDVKEYVLDKCKTKEEIDRVNEEMILFENHSMIEPLKLMIYLVDIMRTNNIVWGVGRGSSVASYVLYLIGIHKINSLKYDIDINEFLK